jgi:hypothetical protein
MEESLEAVLVQGRAEVKWLNIMPFKASSLGRSP